MSNHSTYTRTGTCQIDISDSATISDAFYVGGEFSLVGIKYPADWTAASISFLVSFDGVTYENLLSDAGTEVVKTVTAAQYRELDSSEFKSAVWLKIRSGVAGAAVNQLADRDFTLYMRRYAAR